MIIRPSRDSDRDEILRFIQEMGFNARDARTWDGLKMLAVTAWQGDELIAALPLEPRLLQMPDGDPIPALHETVVAVRPEFRGQGIGSRLQQALFDSPPSDAMLATVFREDPQSPAYHWYVRNGFAPAMHVESWFGDDSQSPPRLPDFETWEFPDSHISWSALDDLWDQSMSRAAGIVSRRHRPLRHWLPIHPYARHYQFHILLTRQNNSPIGYALLGIGQMHSPTTRVDILELCAADENTAAPVLQAVHHFAARNSYRPIRWPLATTDPLRRLAQAIGMTSRWNFDMLVRPLHPSFSLKPKFTRYIGADYA